MPPPVIAAAAPAQVHLDEGRTYFFYTCGKSAKQPFCDGSHAGTDFLPHPFKAEKTGEAWLCQCKRTKSAPFCDGTHSRLP